MTCFSWLDSNYMKTSKREKVTFMRKPWCSSIQLKSSVASLSRTLSNSVLDSHCMCFVCVCVRCRCFHVCVVRARQFMFGRQCMNWTPFGRLLHIDVTVYACRQKGERQNQCCVCVCICNLYPHSDFEINWKEALSRLFTNWQHAYNSHICVWGL